MSIKAITHDHILKKFPNMDRNCLILVVSKKSLGQEFEMIASVSGLSSYILIYDPNDNSGRETFTRLRGTHFQIEREWSLYLVTEGSVRVKYSIRPRTETDIRLLVADIMSKVRPPPPAQGPIYPTNQGTQIPNQQPHGLVQVNRSLGSGQVNIYSISSKMIEGDESFIPHNQNWKSLLKDQE